LSVSLTSDGAWLATGSKDRRTRLCKKATDTFTWEFVQTLEDATGVIASVSLTSDGAWPATGSGDVKARLYKKGDDTRELAQTLEDAGVNHHPHHSTSP
jgi:WD40 repeat protein